MSDFRAGRLDAVRAKVAALEAGGRGDCGSLPFGDARIDARLPGGGLPLGRWHEVTGEGMEAETAAAPAAFAALLAAPLARRGWAVWVLRRDDLHAPGLEGLGFPPERLIQVCARDD
ncbi:MAG: protein imuA, partial [Phenylobacterium sp.]|nr:protein imuA [Phenylobacterium sp.]